MSVAPGQVYDPGTTSPNWSCNQAAQQAGDKCLVRGNALLGYYLQHQTTGPTTVKAWPLDRELFLHGYKRTTSITVTCWASADSNTFVTNVVTSAVHRDDEPVDLDAPACAPGQVPRSLLVTRTAVGGTPQTVWWWDHPAKAAGITTLPTPTRQCWIVGVTSCPIYDSDPANPSNDLQVGGIGGTAVAPGPTITDVLRPGVKSVAQPDPVAPPTTTPTPTTTAAPSPTTTIPGAPTTLPPAGPADPPGAPTPPPGGPSGGAGAWGTCMNERTEGAFEDININPITWVRAIVLWMVAPIICAVWWLFVPPGGWGALIADLRDLWANAPALAPIRAFSTALTVDTSRCFPVDLPSVGGIDIPTIDVALCGNPVVTMVWGVAVALGVLAIAREAIRTVSRLAAFDSVTGGFNSDSQYYMR